MKKILILCLLMNTVAFAQKKRNIYFLKNNGREVPIKDSADFIRIIEEPDSGEVNYNLSEYYPNNQKKLLGHVSRFEPHLVYEGQIITYYPNGNKEAVENYENGKRNGPSFHYYKNGRIKESVEFIRDGEPPAVSNDFSTEKRKLISYFDSTGTELVKDGKGYVKYYDGKESRGEEGGYSGGEKDGVWKGRLGQSSYEEIFQNGIFISGTATFPDGKKKEYKQQNQLPDFKGGMSEFYKYVSRNFKYPREARERGVSGRLIMSFVVEKDGKITEIKTVKDLGLGTGEAAIEMLESSPKWIPGTQHGIPVRVAYTLPIMLNLGPAPLTEERSPFGSSTIQGMPVRRPGY